MGALDLVLPPACAGCGRYGSVLCAACVDTLRTASAAADRFMTVDPGVVVGEALELAVAAFRHEGAARRALQRLKYGSAARLSEPLASAAVPALRGLLDRVEPPVTLTPVPVHHERLRQRGYNQAALLAAVLARAAGIPIADLLVRVRPTVRQHGLGRAARLHNLRGAFALRAPPPSGTVIVVDDILTTAATLEACAEVLVTGGAQRVMGFAIAREV